MNDFVTLHTRVDENFERNLQETSRQSGVPVERLRQMVANLNATIFTPPPIKEEKAKRG